MQAVNAGQVPVGIIYHYYWYRDQAESGENSGEHRAALLRQPGPGRVRQRLRRRACSKSSEHPDEAQQFLAFLTGAEGQQMLADSDAMEYAVGQRRRLPTRPCRRSTTLEPPDGRPLHAQRAARSSS